MEPGEITANEPTRRSPFDVCGSSWAHLPSEQRENRKEQNTCKHSKPMGYLALIFMEGQLRIQPHILNIFKKSWKYMEIQECLGPGNCMNQSGSIHVFFLPGSSGFPWPCAGHPIRSLRAAPVGRSRNGNENEGHAACPEEAVVTKNVHFLRKKWQVVSFANRGTCKKEPGFDPLEWC